MDNYLNRFVRFILATEKLEKAVQRAKNLRMAGIGLRGGHVMCLFYLHKHEEGMTAAELARQCEVDRAFISRTVNELTEVGCIASLPTTGKRRSHLCLTKKGQELAEEMDRMVRDYVCLAIQGISDEELEVFYRVAGRLEENISTGFGQSHQTCPPATGE